MQNRILEGNELYGVPYSQEQAFRISGQRVNTQEQHEREMYKDAARRTVFHSCMDHCEIPQEDIPNFNANFYYNQKSEQQCL